MLGCRELAGPARAEGIAGHIVVVAAAAVVVAVVVAGVVVVAAVSLDPSCLSFYLLYK
jgi:hypothetical protein